MDSGLNGVKISTFWLHMLLKISNNSRFNIKSFHAVLDLS